MSNTSIVSLKDGREVLLSYGVPVAAFIPGSGKVRRARKFSTTTSRHANAYAGASSPEMGEPEFEAAVYPLDMKG